MKTLIITEKPSVCKDIVKVLGGFSSKNHEAYWESQDFFCTFAVGHLLELCSPEDIDPGLRRWSFQTLPILPETFEIKAKKQQEKRLKAIKKLLFHKETEFIINACDAAREGELIFREIIQYFGCTKPVKRLWLQSMTKTAIKKGFDHLQDDKTVQGLAKAAQCRSQADWLIGMNTTRALSIRLKTKSERSAWTAGRVQTPTLSILVKKELEILRYRSQPYWKIEARFCHQENDYTGIWFDRNFRADREDHDHKSDRIFDETTSQEILRKISTPNRVSAWDICKKKIQKAPSLFNLTALQREMNRQHKWSAKRTLQVAQRCYETHKVLTYPRTSSICLPEDYRQEVRKLRDALGKHPDYAAFTKDLKKTTPKNEFKIFRNAGVSDHFAIIPTGVLMDLDRDNAKLFNAVVKRFFAAFYPDALFDKTERITEVDGHFFRSGPVDVLLDPGWLKIYHNKTSHSPKINLVPLAAKTSEDNRVPVVFQEADSKEFLTKAPSRIGEAKLLSLMEHAGRHIEDEKLAEVLMSAQGLGTAATRADIIENLKSKCYVDQNLRPTPKGIRLIDTLERIGAEYLTSPELTAQLELHLSEVENAQRDAKKFMNEISQYVQKVVKLAHEFKFDKIYKNIDPLGQCPLCQNKQVYERAWFYSCETQTLKTEGCGLKIWKDFSGRYIDRKVVEELLSFGKTDVLDGFYNSADRSYKAALTLKKAKVVSIISDDLNQVEPINQEPLGTCPLHNSSCQVVETPYAYSCQKNLQEGENGFFLPKILCKRPIERHEAYYFMTKRETPVWANFISKKGRKFQAKLVLNHEGGFRFEFPVRKKNSPGTSKKT